jgi:hypothetical protein
MELLNEDEFSEYIQRNYECIITTESYSVESEIPGTCDVCQRDAFFKVYSQEYANPYSSRSSGIRFVVILVQCPSCKRKSFLQTVQLAGEEKIESDDETAPETKDVYKYYKLYCLPTIEENYANKDIPDEYVSLKNTISEASFCLSHSRNLAAAILFRRAIQILAKDILGAIGKTLYLQLEWLKENENKLKIDLTDVFHDNSKIIKDIGNQGAHPDDDMTLHDFTKEETNGLHDLFVSIVHEVFIKPVRLKALQEELKQSRKLRS